MAKKKKKTNTSPASPALSKFKIFKKSNWSNSPWTKVFIGVLLAYFLLVAIYGGFGHLNRLDRHVRGSDGIYYYIYLPSLFFDKDLDFSNDTKRFRSGIRKGVTPLGYPENVFSVGPAVLWSPFFGLGHVCTLIHNSLGENLPMDGYSYYYKAFVYISNTLYAFLGLIFLVLALRKFFSPVSVFWTTLSIIFSTQLTFYMFSQQLMSHSVSFATASCFFYMALEHGYRKRTAFIAGLMIMARWQNAIYLLVMLPSVLPPLLTALQTKEKRPKKILLLAKDYFLFLAVLLATFSPQMLAWKYLYGSFFTIPQGSSFIDFNHLPWLKFLFATNHGLFSWHPLLLIALVGLFGFLKRDKWLGLAILSAFMLQYILSAAVHDWYSMWSFGQRRFTSFLPFFAVGLAYLFSLIKTRKVFAGVACALCLAGLWNLIFIHQFRTNLIPHMAKPLTFQQMVTDKLRIVHLHELRQVLDASIYFLERGKTKAFHHYAAEAYKKDSEYADSLAVYALACLQNKENHLAFAILEKWKEIYPNEITPRWILAERLVRSEKYQKALEMLSPTKCDNPALCLKLQKKVRNRAPSLMGRNFLRTYHKRLVQNRYD